MFVPPEQRHPGSSPWDDPPRKPAAPSRGEAFGLWLVGLLLVSIVLAPMGGTSLFDAVWYILRH